MGPKVNIKSDIFGGKMAKKDKKISEKKLEQVAGGGREIPDATQESIPPVQDIDQAEDEGQLTGSSVDESSFGSGASAPELEDKALLPGTPPELKSALNKSKKMAGKGVRFADEAEDSGGIIGTEYDALRYGVYEDGGQEESKGYTPAEERGFRTDRSAAVEDEIAWLSQKLATLLQKPEASTDDKTKIQDLNEKIAQLKKRSELNPAGIYTQMEKAPGNSFTNFGKNIDKLQDYMAKFHNFLNYDVTHDLDTDLNDKLNIAEQAIKAFKSNNLDGEKDKRGFFKRIFEYLFTKNDSRYESLNNDYERTLKRINNIRNAIAGK
ncbi:hypothetical protein JYT19_00505 [Sulfobacillus acidophilus]|uniref:Uncharacterized protein n=1 Tax=Sulfobacillus acidophilus TaxID=53633 RepID=A0ABS3AX24_9FIRM|nr:hypothetical protein [Sulfobacillus acidophilus]